MNGTDGTPVVPMQGLSAVAVSGIEASLAQRWVTLLRKQDHPRSHSCVMTLLIAVEDETDNKSVFDVVSQLAGKYPLRVITVQSTSRAADEVFAWVNAECEGEPAAPICSEEIVLQSGGEAIDRIVSAVRSLLVADLPVYLWWRGNTPHGEVLWNGLRPMCDRIIVDSIRFGDGAAALDTLRSLVSIGGEAMSVHDLNWERTQPWRTAIATCFDDRDAQALLPDIDRASIVYASQSETEKPSARAMLMTGWLVNRVPRLRSQCRTAPAKRTADVAPGRIVSISLLSSRSKASLVLVRNDSPLGIEVQASNVRGETFKRWTFRASTLSEAQLLDACLETPGKDTVFESALEM